MKSLLASLLFLLSFTLTAQNFNMIPGDNGGAGFQYTGCSALTFYDTGGPRGDYDNNENNIAVFCPDITTDLAELNFVRLDLGPGDLLVIYDGDSIAAPVLASLDETSAAPGLLRATSSTPGGCLTVRFQSDGSGTGTGWAASRGCFNPCQAISTVISTTPAADADGIIRICQGDQITFDGSATFSDDATGATYSWDLGNGGGLNPGQVQSETYLQPGAYSVRFVATDQFGCSDRTDVDLSIQVSTDPDFTGTRADDSSICFGESTDLFGNATPIEFSVEITPPVTGTTFLPDGSGVSYRTCVSVDGFPLGATLNNASDLLEIFINMEHSYTGDLDILLTSPSGATLEIFTQAGGSTYFGEPIDVDTNLNPGVGYDYFITESRAATQTLSQAAAATGGATAVPIGDYLANDPFANLVGSALNGDWCLTITDYLTSDNGYIFYWGLNFDPSIVPDELTYTPEEVSSRWLPNPDITADNGDVVTVQPSSSGQNCYTYEFTDSFGCVYTQDVCIDVTPEIPVGIPNDFTICDTGITTTVDLTDNDLILLNGLNSALYQVNYYPTENDAINGTSRITNASNYPFGTTSQTVFSAVRDVIGGCVNVQPVIINVIDFSDIVIPEIVECESIVGLDLEQYIRDNTSIGDSTDITITVHNNQNDADLGINPVPNINNYDQLSGSEQFFVKIQSSTDASCAAVSTIDIDVTPSVTTTTLSNLEICDVNDGSPYSFDLGTQDTDVLNGSNAADFTITYHASLTDAENGDADLPLTGYEITTLNETIHVRIESVSNPVCYTLNQFDINVSIEPVFNAVDDIVRCDAGNDDEETFDLTARESDILDGQTGVQVTYHTSMNEALSGASPITTPAAYVNNVAPIETIYVRLFRADNTICQVTTGSFNLELITEPVVNPVNDIVFCDEGSNGEETFDFDPLIPQILLTQSSTNYNVTFHDELTDAQNGQDELPLNGYTNTSASQTIYIRVEVGSNTDCYTIGDFDIEVTPLPVLTAVDDLSLCDDLSEDGLEIFNLTENENDIVATVGSTNLTVTYHDSQNDALDGLDALNNVTAFENTTTPETIYVRVLDNDTGCANVTNFDLIVLPIPAVGNPVDIQECDETGALQATFTLSENTNLIIDGQTDVTVSYFETRAAAIAGGLGLDDNDYQNASTTQTIFYRVENNSTSCFNIGDFQIEAVDAPIALSPMPLESCDTGSGTTSVDLIQLTNDVTAGQANRTLTFYESLPNAEAQSAAVSNPYNYTADTRLFIRVDDDNTDCVSFTTVDLIFNELPQPNLLSEYLLCVDENGNLINGPTVMDTGLDNSDYSFEWFVDGNLIVGANNSSYGAVVAGSYEVVATDLATGCANNETTIVRQLGAPETYDVTILTDPFTFTHNVIATATGPDEYWFSLDNGPYLYTGNFEDVLPGPHTVTIAERNGCGEIVEDIFVFGYPDFFTPNDDGYHDTWNIIGGDLLPGTQLYIFDRYGKLIKQVDPSGAGWDGTFNGEPLPSTDYWFRIEYEFNGVQAEATGHFAMKR